jgi:hypothetical protein
MYGWSGGTVSRIPMAGATENFSLVGSKNADGHPWQSEGICGSTSKNIRRSEDVPSGCMRFVRNPGPHYRLAYTILVPMDTGVPGYAWLGPRWIQMTPPRSVGLLPIIDHFQGETPAELLACVLAAPRVRMDPLFGAGWAATHRQLAAEVAMVEALGVTPDPAGDEAEALSFASDVLTRSEASARSWLAAAQGAVARSAAQTGTPVA